MSEGLEAIFFLSFSFFLVGSVGDVSRVLLACVLHARGAFLPIADVFLARGAFLPIVDVFLAMSE